MLLRCFCGEHALNKCRVSDKSLNPAAAYLIAGISGRLGGEVVRFFMNDHRFADDIRQGESLIIKDTEGIALTAEQWWHIACVIGVHCILWIIVRSRVAEVIAAISRLVDMHGIEIACAGGVHVGEAEDLCLHQDAAVDGVIKFH